MNKIVSLAIKKAVSEYNPKVEKVENDNRPDLLVGAEDGFLYYGRNPHTPEGR